MDYIEHINEIFSLLKKNLKNYKPPVLSKNEWNEVRQTPFTSLISCILSLRTKDEINEQASIKLLKNYNTPKKILEL